MRCHVTLDKSACAFTNPELGETKHEMTSMLLGGNFFWSRFCDQDKSNNGKTRLIRPPAGRWTAK